MARRFSFPQPAGSQAQAGRSRHRESRPGHRAGRLDPLASGTLLSATLLAMLLVGVLFATWPQLDLAIAQDFARASGGFVGDSATGRALRKVFETLPFLLIAGLAACYALRRLGGIGLWAPNGAGLVMVAASLALGPGLLVNTMLKDHSHRPRPVQVTEFGGPFAFRPFYRFDGDCQRNCSFVSGEGSTAAWTLGPASLAPPPYRIMAVTASLVFTAATSLLRMSFGGHFASDSLFAALLTWLVILGCWRLVAALADRPPGSYREPATHRQGLFTESDS